VLLNYPPVTVPARLIAVLTPNSEGVQKHKVLGVPRSDEVLNVQLAIEFTLVLWFRLDSDIDSRELQTLGRKHRTQYGPDVRSKFVEFEPMLSVWALPSRQAFTTADPLYYSSFARSAGQTASAIRDARCTSWSKTPTSASRGLYRHFSNGLRVSPVGMLYIPRPAVTFANSKFLIQDSQINGVLDQIAPITAVRDFQGFQDREAYAKA
jgi:hypothetical protein